MSSKWIWPFELLDKLGEGGMGVVYRARYVGNNRIVAVKLLPDDVAANASVVARFEREVEILQQLKHPNIVHCFGGVCESKQRFYAMEVVEGGTLADLLERKGKLSWHHVVEFGRQMCAALHYAHERGVVHRDVKPGNFLLGKGEQLKLSDFGLATMAAATRITRAGKTAGTFVYMSPEQIRGQPPVTPKADLYALGCVLYEMLTGRPPFEADNPAAVLHQHLKETAPRASVLAPDCPPELADVIADLLQKDPDLRPASAHTVELQLERVMHPSRKGFQTLTVSPDRGWLPTVEATDAVKVEGDGALPVSIASAPASKAGWVMATLLAVVAVLGWWRSMEMSARAARWEASWIAILQRTEPGWQFFALEQIARQGPLSGASRQAVLQLLESPSDATRQAALRAMEQQPIGFRPQSTQLLRMQKEDEMPAVRGQAERTLKAVQAAPNPPGTMWVWILWTVTVLGFIAAIIYFRLPNVQERIMALKRMAGS